MRNVRNFSFLAFVVAVLFSANLSADGPTCAEQAEACAEGFGGQLCWAGSIGCFGDGMWMTSRCVRNYSQGVNCMVPHEDDETLWLGSCQMSPTCGG